MAEPDRATQVAMYEIMTKIKQCDERLRAALMSGQAAFMYYSPRGQEVIPAAITVNLTSDDYVVTTYRGMHDQVAKGVPLNELWAEYFGKETGSCKGKGGPMHITHAATGLMVTTGVVGGGIPIANGLALASKLKGDGRVTVVNFGDGATNIGAFHEALNLAQLWKLPVVFVCQNNRYGEHTAIADHMVNTRVADRAAGYGMVGVTVDGNDPLAMYGAAAEAINRAREGDGPTLIEAMTYRFFGHFVGDASDYMPTDEYQMALTADPVPAFRARLIADGHVSEDELAALEKRIEGELDEAAEFAKSSPFPDLTEIGRDVYAQEVPA
jgi:pyruvate dehydrogenase E1 component alpha subunit